MHGVHKCAVSLEPHTHPGMPGIRPAAAPWAARVALAGRAILAGGSRLTPGGVRLRFALRQQRSPGREVGTSAVGWRGRVQAGRAAEFPGKGGHRRGAAPTPQRFRIAERRA